MQVRINNKVLLVLCVVTPIFLVFISLFIGRYPLSISQVVTILTSGYNNIAAGITPIQHTVLWDMRMPRALMALLVGGALAVSGGALQGVFRNPLVDSGMLGVSAGAGFGACIAIILFHNIFFTYVFAFAFGIIAVVLSYATGKIYKTAPTVTLVLGGVVISSIFSALISFTKYVADPYEQLPAITFWLMGSLARANYADLAIAMIPIFIGIIGIMLIRWRINLLSLGDREAGTLGVNTTLCRGIIIASTALATAGAVCISGTIGWIGLVIPHIGRMIVGNDNRRLLPLCLAMGGSFLLIVDDLGRSITGSEIPLGVLTALIGGPFYIYLLKKTKGG
ncbi:MAG: iron ABC transporter permease, partial [Clostridia bacterium]|nr:iron ABC transporter permease [Clostridia bacterium]